MQELIRFLQEVKERKVGNFADTQKYRVTKGLNAIDDPMTFQRSFKRSSSAKPLLKYMEKYLPLISRQPNFWLSLRA